MKNLHETSLGLGSRHADHQGCDGASCCSPVSLRFTDRAQKQLKAWLFAMMMTIGMVLGMSAAQAEDISGTIYNDVGGSLAYNAKRDFPVQGVTVTITNTSNAADVKTVTTGADGAYTATGLTAGYSYKIGITGVPTGYAVASADTTVVLPTGGSTGNNLGVRGTGGSIAGLVFEDSNRNLIFDGSDGSISNIRVYLKKDGVVLSELDTLVAGYVFNNLPSGVAYTIEMEEDDLTGYALIGATDSTINSPKQGITVASVTSALTRKSFAVTEINSGGIQGYVINDIDKDNAYNDAYLYDLPVAGATVTLYYGDGVTPVPGVAVATSNADGTYKLSNVPLWQGYKVKVSNLPANFTSSGTVAGTSAPKDIITADVTTKDSAYGANNFYIQGTAGKVGGVSGYAFLDVNTSLPFPNASGLTTNNPDAADSLLNNVLITLKKDGADYLQQYSKSGAYSFVGIPAGSYEVVFDTTSSAIPSNYRLEDDYDGGRDGKISVIVASATVTSQNAWWVLNEKRALFMWSKVPYRIKNVANESSILRSTPQENGVFLSGTAITLPGGTYNVYHLDGTLAAGPLVVNHTYGFGTPDYVNFGNILDIGRYYVEFDPAASAAAGFPAGWTAYAGNRQNARTTSTGTYTTVWWYFFGGEPEGITGRVFVDANGNGVYDPGEELSRAIIRLYDNNNGTYLAPRVTNTDGTYAFYNLTHDNFRVEVYDLSNVDAGILAMIDQTSRHDNDGLSDDGILNVTIPTGGAANRNIWFNVKSSLTHSIQGKVHVDSWGGAGATSGNNQLDQAIQYVSSPADFYLKGATVTLYKDSVDTTPVASMVTGSNGAYQFDGLDSNATYYAVVTASGYTAITNTSQDLPGDTHASAFGSTVELWEGTSKNFLMKGEGNLQSTVFVDFNGNGIYDGASSGEQQVSMVGAGVLYIWDEDLNNWRQLMSISNLNSSVQNLGAGKYKMTRTWAGIYQNTAGTTPVLEAEFVIGSGNLSPEINFFSQAPSSSAVIGSVSGTLRLDTNGNGLIDSGDLPVTGLSGVTLEIYRTHQLRDSVAAGTAPISVYTAMVNTDGTYFIPGGLNVYPPGAGNFIVKLVGLPTGYTLINDFDGPTAPAGTDLGITSSLGVIQWRVSTSSLIGQDFLVQTDTKISGRVYQDVDYDGVYASDADTVITGRVVSLYDSTGITLLTSQTVNSAGEYTFGSLPYGDYVVKVDGTPTGMVIASGSANSWNVSLSSSTFSVEKSFWYNLDGDAGIAGSIMIDVNNNGISENTYDFPLANAKVTLYGSDGITPVSVAGVTNPTYTNSRGAYKFIGIPTGTYVVDISPLISDYSVYKTYNGLSDSTVTTSQKITVVMTTKAMYTDRTFLLAGDTNGNPGTGPGGPGSLTSGVSGYLYVGDSTSHSAGTTYLPHAEITLTNSDGNSVTAKTDSNGRYQFYNLATGKYTVSLASSPSGYSVKGDVDGAPFGKIVDIQATTGTEKTEQNMWFIAISEKGVTGKVTYSPTQSGTASATDVPVSGLTVELYDANNLTGSPLYTSITNATGGYSFPNIATMDYVVKVKDQDKIDHGYVNLSPLAGSYSVTVTAAGVENQDFILGGVHSLSGKIGIDSDGDDAIDINLANVHTKVTWYGSDGVLGTADDVIFSSDTTISGAAGRTTGQTNSTGDYSYATLPNGNYKIEVLDSTLTSSGIGLVTTITDNTNPRDQANVTTNQTGIDFIYGYVGKISGKVVIDIDASGSVTEADQIWTSSTLIIRLEDNSDSTNFKTLTTTDGTFSFIGIDPTKTWKISVSSGIATGYGFSFGFGDSNNTTVGNAYATVALTTTSPSKTGVVLGYKGEGKIQGKVVMDNVLTDGKVATSADTSLGANIKVKVSSTATGFTSWTVNTAADGSYEITDLAPYAYTISIDKTQSGFQPGLIESFDPDSTETAPTPPTGDGTAVVTLNSPTQILTQKDFGYKGRGSISGKILIDVEGSGTKTAVDHSFGSAITVTATQGTITRTTTANATNGEFSFDTIPTGIWEIYVASPPAGYSFSYGEGSPSTAIEVSSDRVKVNINSAIGTRATTPTLNAIEVNLGYKGSAIIKGRLIYDHDDTDGTAYNSSTDTLFEAGYTVTLSGGTGFTSRTVTTNASGEYEFIGLTTYADYKVTVLSPTGYVFSFDPDTVPVVAPDIPVGDGEAVIPITSPTEIKTPLQDFGFKGAGKIAGKIYIDLNDNGTFNSSTDLPKSGIVVTLTHATLPSRTATTDANGDYVVTGVPAGEWTVEVTGGLTGLRLPSFDYDDAFDPAGAPATPNKAVLQLPSASPIIENADFGYINRGKLAGVIKEDMLATGLYDPSAAGIAGVTVHLVENDGLTPKTYADGSSVILTTDANGHFTARNLDCPTSGATYSVRVEFGPSAAGPLNLMEPSYDSDTLSAGCGSGVDLANGRHVVNADLTAALTERTPTDLYLGYRQATGELVIMKTAGKATAKIGDIVPYTITIENMSEAPALNVTIEDLIPAGFKYVDGSSRLDGVKIEDPKGNRPLRFEEIDLGGATGAGVENSKRKLTYFLVVGSGVTQGEYTNSAVGKNQFNKVASNTSQATVEITSDPLFDDSLIFGKVYIDSNGNGEQDAEEEGLGGIKLATGRGEIITTDEHGRYHIPAVDGGRWERGRNFILKLDVRSLPAGYKVISDNPIVVRTSPGLPSKINFRVKEIEVKDQETNKE